MFFVISQKFLRNIMEITGKIIYVLPERGGTSKTTGNEWKVQEYVIETHEQYPRKCVFNVFGADRISQFNIQVGEELTVSFDIDAREWNGRWFNDIRAWKVERVSEAGAAPAPAEAAAPAPAIDAPFPSPSDAPAQESVDDLPF